MVFLTKLPLLPQSISNGSLNRGFEPLLLSGAFIKTDYFFSYPPSSWVTGPVSQLQPLNQVQNTIITIPKQKQKDDLELHQKMYSIVGKRSQRLLNTIIEMLMYSSSCRDHKKFIYLYAAWFELILVILLPCFWSSTFLYHLLSLFLMQLYARRHFLFPPLSIEEYNDCVMAVVRCEAQDALLQRLLKDNFLSEEERNVLRWGKNISSAKTRTKKRAGAAVYNRASSLETLVGHLYLTDVKRLEEVMVKLGFSTDSSMQLTSEDANGKSAPASEDANGQAS